MFLNKFWKFVSLFNCNTTFSILFANKFNAEFVLPFAMHCLNFFDISTINDVFCMVFRDARIVSPEKYRLRKKCTYSEFFWSVFSRIRIEYGEILRISSYTVWIRENTDQKNSEYWHFSHSDNCSNFPLVLSGVPMLADDLFT